MATFTAARAAASFPVTAETIVTVNCVATAATFAAGTLSVVVHYFVP